MKLVILYARPRYINSFRLDGCETALNFFVFSEWFVHWCTDEATFSGIIWYDVNIRRNRLQKQYMIYKMNL
jgi:hypothetical protein